MSMALSPRQEFTRGFARDRIALAAFWALCLLLLAAIFENIGFRQLTALCMLPGIRWRPTHSKDPKQ